MRRKPSEAMGKDDPEDAQRLQKVLAQAGLGSRREMEELIEQGRVSINGQVAELGARVGSTDVVRVDSKIVRFKARSKPPRILLYHKPEGEIVSRDDPDGRNSVFDNLPLVRGAKWIAVGRLDFNTSGLLIFTTSGDLANKLMHPRFEVEREYAVRVMGELKPEQIKQLRAGVELEDGIASMDSVRDEGGEGSNHWYRVVLKEGRNREVRRLFEAMAVMVTRLIRVRFGPIALPARLKRGRWMEVEPLDVSAILTWAGLHKDGAVVEAPRERISAAAAKRIGAPRSAAAPGKKLSAPPSKPRVRAVAPKPVARGAAGTRARRPQKSPAR